jgi:crossover junction endodeoxyribonuclease RuvC
MRVLGIDPGLATIGIGIVSGTSPEDLVAEDWLAITTPAGGTLAERLGEIEKDFAELTRDLRPDLIVIERLFFATNAQTAIEVAQARGVLLLGCNKMGVPILEPTPLQMKLAITGDGQADKRQVQDMLMHLLKLKELPRPDDAADALALAAYGALQHRMAVISGQ